MENNKLKELAQEYFATYKTIDEQSLYTFLADNQWKIYAYYQKQSLEDTIRTELDEDNFDVKRIPETLIESMAYDLEEQIFDEYEFRDMMSNIIDFYKEDLKEYKLEEINNE